MDILNTTSLESNKQIEINFDGGDYGLRRVMYTSARFFSYMKAMHNNIRILCKLGQI